MAKNLILGPILACLSEIWALKIFSWILLLIDLRYCRKLSLYSISRKKYDPNSRKWGKTSFGPDLDTLDPNSGRQFVFSKIWFGQSLDIMVRYHHAKYLKKTNDPILKKIY